MAVFSSTFLINKEGQISLLGERRAVALAPKPELGFDRENDPECLDCGLESDLWKEDDLLGLEYAIGGANLSYFSNL